MFNSTEQIYFVALFFCSKFVSSAEAEEVGATRFLNISRVEVLGSTDSPVRVDLVGNSKTKPVAGREPEGRLDSGLVAEVVLDATTDEGRGALDAFGLLGILAVAVDSLEGVVDTVLELLVAASHDLAAGQVSTGPVEGVLALGLVHELREDVLLVLHVAPSRDTNVELVSDLNVDLGLDGRGVVLLALNNGLNAKVCEHARKG